MIINRIPSKERGCINKTNIGSDYKKQSDMLANKRQKRFGVYQCPHCGGYHLTTKIENAHKYGGLLHVAIPKGAQN